MDRTYACLIRRCAAAGDLQAESLAWHNRLHTRRSILSFDQRSYSGGNGGSHRVDHGTLRTSSTR